MAKKFSFICRATVEAKTETEAIRKIQSSSGFEKHFGVEFEVIDLKKKFPKQEPKSGTKDSSFNDPMSRLRTEVRRIQGKS